MDVLDLLHRGCVEVAGRDVGPLSLQTDLDALGLDSIQTMELVAWTEDKLGFRVPDEVLGRLRTVGDLHAAFASGDRVQSSRLPAV